MNQKERVLKGFSIFLLSFIALGIVFVVRILWLQYVEGSELRSYGEKRAYKESVLPASRGNILAEDGRLLATSMPKYDLYMDFLASALTDSVFTANIDSISQYLSHLFKDKSAESYRRELIKQRNASNRYYRLGRRSINYLELKYLKEIALFRKDQNKSGLIVEHKEQRMKPLGILASRTIGNVNSGMGVGLEGAYNPELEGKQGMRIMQRAPNKKYIPVGSADYIAPQDGYDLVTTIDLNLQDVVTRALATQLRKNDADHGTVVVMEVATGEVKAIANLTRTEHQEYIEKVNYAVGASTEPGSTFKIATLIALLEDGKVKLTDSINTDNGQLRIYDQVISDSRKGGYGILTVQQAWELSSNVAVAKLVLKNYQGHAEEFVSHLYSMRLHLPLDVPLLGEGRPYIKAPGDTLWSGVSLPMMSIGYEVQQTPLQILTFYNAIANNGCMVRPRFVKELMHHGRVVRRYKREVLVPSICSKETIKQVRQVLEGVVKSGTASNLQTAIYTIAGKTGTAQIARGKSGYRNSGKIEYQASFVGYFPADTPRYSCIVVVSSPTQSGYYGNVVAGPIFREIAEKIYSTRSEWFPWYTDTERDDYNLPSSKPGAKAELIRAFRELDLEYVDDSYTNRWVNTSRVGDKIVMTTHPTQTGHVPNVVGFPLSDALYLLENAGLTVHFRGRGSVRKQSISPGTPIHKGAIIELEMSVL